MRSRGGRKQEVLEIRRARGCMSFRPNRIRNHGGVVLGRERAYICHRSRITTSSGERETSFLRQRLSVAIKAWIHTKLHQNIFFTRPSWGLPDRPCVNPSFYTTFVFTSKKKKKKKKICNICAILYIYIYIRYVTLHQWIELKNISEHFTRCTKLLTSIAIINASLQVAWSGLWCLIRTTEIGSWRSQSAPAASGWYADIIRMRGLRLGCNLYTNSAYMVAEQRATSTRANFSPSVWSTI